MPLNWNGKMARKALNPDLLIQKTRHITVLGAGVSGLSTARVLQQRGFSVDIITKEETSDTTSSVAAAIWFPYRVAPQEKAADWSAVSYRHYLQLSGIPESGVSMIPFNIFHKKGDAPKWIEALPPEAEQIQKQPASDASLECYSSRFPLIESHIYLPWMINAFEEAGGQIHKRKLTNLSEIPGNHPVLNCTGLGAAELFGDVELFPVKGQVVKVSHPEEKVTGMSAEFPYTNDPDGLTYIIPRSDGIIVGGSAEEGNFDKSPDSSRSTKILEYASEYAPALQRSEILEVKTGLRPCRSAVRLEKEVIDGRIFIHNYGHGGAGFTVAPGCAREAAALVEQDLE